MQETRTVATQHSPADVLAREVEEQMTDDERFFLVVSVMGGKPGHSASPGRTHPRGDTHELGLHAWRAAPRCTSASDEQRKPRCH